MSASEAAQTRAISIPDEAVPCPTIPTLQPRTAPEAHQYSDLAKNTPTYKPDWSRGQKTKGQLAPGRYYISRELTLSLYGPALVTGRPEAERLRAPKQQREDRPRQQEQAGGLDVGDASECTATNDGGERESQGRARCDC
jgi:hypothetical protein